MSATAIHHDHDLLAVRGTAKTQAAAVDEPEAVATEDGLALGFEVEPESGQSVTFETAEGLRDAVLEGRVSRTARARSVIPGGDGTHAEWSTVEDIAIGHPLLRDAYRPVWGHALRYMGYGAIAGIVLKLLDTTLLMFAIDGGLGLIWLMVVGSLALSSEWSLAPVFAIWLTIKAGVGNLFLTALTSGLVGLAFGLPIGLLIGTLVGHAKRKSVATAPDARPEGRRPYLLGIALPVAFLSAAVPAYVWFNLWFLTQ